MPARWHAWIGIAHLCAILPSWLSRYVATFLHSEPPPRELVARPVHSNAMIVRSKATQMLKITANDAADGLTLKLEGRLAGVWVAELEECWRKSSSSLSGRPLRVDLSGVDYVDTAGRYLLVLMHRAGATFVVAGCMMAALVQDITGNWPAVAAIKRKRA